MYFVLVLFTEESYISTSLVIKSSLCN